MDDTSEHSETKEDNAVSVDANSDHDLCSETVATTGTLAQIDHNCSNVDAFPSLPAEIIILIFTYAAWDSKATAASLSLVSRFARIAALPLLFRTLVRQKRTFAKGLSHFLHAHPHIALHVRELWLRQSIGSDSLLVLPCVRLKRLAVNPSCFSTLCSSSDTLSSVLWKEFEEHSVECASLCRPIELLLFPGRARWSDFILGMSSAYTHSFFLSLTRLWLSQASQLHELLDCQEVTTALAHLTHLAAPVSGLVVKVSVQDVLSIFPALRMFVITPQPRHDPWLTQWRWSASMENELFSNDCLQAPHDKRVYFLDEAGGMTEDLLFESWKEGGCIWTRAKPITDLNEFQTRLS